MIDKYHVKYCWKTAHCDCYKLIDCLWLSPPSPHNRLQIHYAMLGPCNRNHMFRHNQEDPIMDSGNEVSNVHSHFNTLVR
jgi:hypothetical protein